VQHPLELLADCSLCRVESAVVELYDPLDPATVLGIPAEARCRLCSAAWRGVVTSATLHPASPMRYRGAGLCPDCGVALNDRSLDAHTCLACGAQALRVLVTPGLDLLDRAVFDGALARFAAEEGEADVADFVEHNLPARTADAVYALVTAGARVETSFDAGFALFHGARHGTPVGRGRSSSPGESAAPTRAKSEAPGGYDPRAMVLALVSVQVADGKRDPREVAFLDRFLTEEGMEPLRPEEVKVHRPVEVAGRIPPGRREALVELMVQLACVDGESDPSEQRLVQSYAGHWGIEAERVEAWFARYQGRYRRDLQRIFARLRAFFLVAPAGRS